MTRSVFSRVRSDWRLLAVVAAVALVATTLITSLGLLVASTEQGGFRRALSEISSSEAVIKVEVFESRATNKEVTSAADSVVRKALGSSATYTSDTRISTSPIAVPGLDSAVPALGYFGEYDGFDTHATLVDGAWPADSPAVAGEVAVAIPQKAAKALGLAVGDSFTARPGKSEIVTTIVGIYTPLKPRATFWRADLLQAAGNDPAFPKPDTREFVPTDVFGPLVADRGALDAASVEAQTIDIDFRPDFSAATVAELDGLITRLDAADDDIHTEMGPIATSVTLATGVGDRVTSIGSSLVVTRSTVTVVTLLLAVLAIAALWQTARLYTDSRETERRLMRARGASGRQVFALAVIEALGVTVISAAAAPPLASLVYRVIASQPAMVEAGMTTEVGIPVLSWLTASGVAVLFGLVLLAPVARQSRLSNGVSTKSRASRVSGVMRSGLDFGLVIVAAVAYFQLQGYRSPVSDTATLSVDPILVAGPALVLVAGAVLCVRLIPPASRLLERLGQRSRGAVFPLAAWEVGRRAQQATAAVLLLTLALAVGTFSQSFLSTWNQSQVDQAEFAVGPPVRVPAHDATVNTQSTALSAGAVGDPQPAIRRLGAVAGPGESFGDDSIATLNAVILGITPKARDLLTRGRLAEEGGSAVERTLDVAADAATGPELPDSATGISATIRIGAIDSRIDGVSARVRAVVEDANGLLSTVDLGAVPADGRPYTVAGNFLDPTSKEKSTGAFRFDGIQAFFFVSDSDSFRDDRATKRAEFLVKDIATVVKGDPATPVALSSTTEWRAASTVELGEAPLVGDVPAGWQLRMSAVLPEDIAVIPATFTLVSWQRQIAIPAVATKGVAKRLNIGVGSGMKVVLPGARVSVGLDGIVSDVPGSVEALRLTPETLGGIATARTEVIVVDQVLLARSLIEHGDTGSFADEWWVDVKPGTAASYIARHPVTASDGFAVAGETLARALQSGPLRIAAQASLWLVTLSAALLAAIGFAVHTAAALRTRRAELAQLRAIGISSRSVVFLIGAESLLLCVLGAFFGIAVGVLLSFLVAPLIAVSPTGTPAVPDVRVVIPWLNISFLAVEIAIVLLVVVALVARAQRSLDPARILRGGSE